MDQNLERQIKELLNAGETIAAIKRFREATGVGLAEAKAAVESLLEGHSFTKQAVPDQTDLTKQIVNHLDRDEKIQAIKLYRQHTASSLREAKDAVERIGEENGIHVSTGIGCLGAIFVGIGLCTGLRN